MERPLLLCALSALLPSCGSSDGGAGAGASLLENQNNYRATGRLTLPTVETSSGVDLDICWTQMVSDVQCHGLSPQVDIDNVALLRFKGLGQEQVEAKLTAGELSQSQIDGYLESRPDHVSTCTRLFDFSFMGSKLKVAEEYREDPAETYMLLFTHGTKTGLGARMMMFIKPLVASTNTKVDAPPGCGTLAFTIDLSSPTRVPVPAAGPWLVDWRNVTVDGLGNQALYSDPDRLFVGFYQDKTVADLEATPFELESMATALWNLPLDGAPTADLAKATNPTTGAAFDGFSHGSGSWILALMCSSCQNPAPIVLVVLDPQGGK